MEGRDHPNMEPIHNSMQAPSSYTSTSAAQPNCTNDHVMNSSRATNDSEAKKTTAMEQSSYPDYKFIHAPSTKDSTSDDSPTASNAESKEPIATPASLTPSTHSPAFPWERLPYEMREKIFRNDKEVPALVVALREFPISYDHVLQWFERESSSLIIGSWNAWALSSMSDMEALCIKKVMMELSGNIDDVYENYEDDGWTFSRFRKPTEFSQRFLRMENLREVHLTMDNACHSHTTTGIYRGLQNFSSQWPYWLEGCTKLSRVELALNLNVWRSYEIDNAKCDRVFQAILNRIAKKIGVKGKAVNMDLTSHAYYDQHAQVWCWEDEPGNYMDWSHEFGIAYYFTGWKESHWNIFSNGSQGCLKFLGGAFVLRDFSLTPLPDGQSW
ncbi:hypothetical protein BDZ45DRAFT_743049 [Acephala macrosclerotiorum]|nr:hypothetical protein BDZ45DRAFT_743049 [Acephala macrosclerotiorum]